MNAEGGLSSWMSARVLGLGRRAGSLMAKRLPWSACRFDAVWWPECLGAVKWVVL